MLLRRFIDSLSKFPKSTAATTYAKKLITNAMTNNPILNAFDGPCDDHRRTVESHETACPETKGDRKRGPTKLCATRCRQERFSCLFSRKSPVLPQATLLVQRYPHFVDTSRLTPAARPAQLVEPVCASRGWPLRNPQSAHFFFGRKATSLVSSVVRYGPSSRSMQYGMAGKTASRHSAIAFGWPGRFNNNDLPRMPAV